MECDDELLVLASDEDVSERATFDALQDIFSLLRSHVGHDFSQYKSNTLCRRIERRMSIYQMSDIADYVEYLKQESGEVQVLSEELLIGVTNFFRDRKAFEILKNHIIPNAIAEKLDQSCFRVWVPACSSGEEAYSIAIILQECIDAMGKSMNFQIFASDIDENAIKVARMGVYSSDIEKDVSAARLKQFFTKADHKYRIKQELRESIIFASQSVIKDPPFTRIDFLSCRNLLIYLGSKLQRKLLPLFHYSLNPSGILFLGASESIGTSTNYFESIEKKHKIYRRKDYEPFNRGKMKFPITQGNLEINKMELSTKKISTSKVNINEHLDALLLENCIPSCIITDKNGDIIYVHGRTGNYVEPATGTASLNIIDMARPGLGTKLSYAIREVNAGKGPICYCNLRITDPVDAYFNLTVKSVLETQTGRALIVVIFDEVNTPEISEKTENDFDDAATNDPRVSELERELKYTKEHLQSTIEELKSTNEELQSTNEELQSTNEELETSKEELVTVNAELERRIDELSNTNDDIKNLLDSTSIATIFLDNQRCVKRFTPKTTEIIRLIPTDIGRSVDDIVHNLKNSDFIKDIGKVIKTNVPIEMEVQNHNSHWYYMRITPYQTVMGELDGVVLTFEDITEIKKHRERLQQLVSDRTKEIQNTNQQLKEEIEKHRHTEAALLRSENRFQRLFELDIMGIFFVNKHYKIVDMNTSFSKMIGYSKKNIPLEMNQILHPDCKVKVQEDSLIPDRTQKDIIPMHEKIYLDANKDNVYVMEAGIVLEEDDLLMVFFVMDMTPSKKVEAQLYEHREQQAHVTRMNTVDELTTGIAHEINQPLTNITNYIRGLQLRIENEETKINKEELFSVMNQIAVQADRSSNIIARMRDLAQKKKAKPEPIDINAAVNEVVDGYKATFQKSEVKINLFLAKSLVPVRIDKVQLEQVLTNLINNAVEALQIEPKPSRVITIRTHEKETAVELIVEDNGSLLSPEKAKKVFDMFYTTKEDGIGMGLGISRTIIESYGGHLHCQPLKDVGNIFKMTLPTK